MIPSSNIAAMSVSLAIAVGLPIVLFIIFYRRRKMTFMPVGIGALVFLVFALLLEQGMHYLVFTNVAAVKTSTFLYVLYGCLAAGVFEETGRFIAYKLILKKQHEWKDGIAYGIGHGGFESIIISLGLVNGIVMSVMINNGTFPFNSIPGEAAHQIAAAQKQLIETPWYEFLLSGLERVFAITAHIGFSLLVLYGVRTGRHIFLLYSILLHALMNVSAALYQRGVLNVYVTEAIVGLFALAVFLFIRRSEKHFPPLNSQPAATGTSPQTP